MYGYSNCGYEVLPINIIHKQQHDYFNAIKSCYRDIITHDCAVISY